MRYRRTYVLNNVNPPLPPLFVAEKQGGAKHRGGTDPPWKCQRGPSPPLWNRPWNIAFHWSRMWMNLIKFCTSEILNTPGFRLDTLYIWNSLHTHTNSFIRKTSIKNLKKCYIFFNFSDSFWLLVKFVIFVTTELFSFLCWIRT